MTSEWVKWNDIVDTTRSVEDKGSYSIYTENLVNRDDRPKPKDIKESIEEAKKAHKQLFEETRASSGFAPTALIIDPEGLWTAVCCPDWADMREDGRRELHKVALRERAVALVWGSDSFYLERDPKDIKDGNWANMERPSEAPDRREAFILTTVWPDGSAEMEMYPYRLEDKKLVWTNDKVPDPKDTQVQQRICPAWAPSTGTVQ